eukprot:gene2344-2651_t
MFHVAPIQGWVNDPNGPFMYQGKYHLFYQHLPEGCEWAFGLVWGHAISTDLVHWEHLPHAIVPTAKTLDADGCFSGCATIDTDGTPVLLYTGVRLRTNPDAQPLPPPECDLQLPFIESQLYATPSNQDDPLLVQWTKDPSPFIGLPPPNMNLTGWRDPFVVERPCEANQHEWVVLMGAGIKEVGGATIVYRTQRLRDASSWRYDGLLCVGDGGTGFCTRSAPLGSWDDRYTHFYSISPDACTNPSIYWLGRYTAGRFDLDNAKGPIRLDLGDVLYAPNVMRDDYGRVIMWGWLQERRTVGTYDYAGCMTVPRLLHLDHDRLHQCPAPELLVLRRGETWQCAHEVLSHGSSLSLPGVVGPHSLDIEAVFAQGSASTVGIFLRSWHQGGEVGAAVLFNWESGLLEVVFEALDPATMAFSLTAPMARRIGGPISHRPGAPLALRLLLDHSVLEIFTGTGEVLSTRVYRGSPPHGHADAGIEFVALDGEATLERVAAYEMASIWDRTAQQAAATAAAAVPEEEALMQELEGLGLEGLDSLMAVADAHQQQLLEKDPCIQINGKVGQSLAG